MAKHAADQPKARRQLVQLGGGNSGGVHHTPNPSVHHQPGMANDIPVIVATEAEIAAVQRRADRPYPTYIPD